MDYGRYTPRNVTMGALGGGGIGSENPVAGFMQGYQFVDNIQRQNAADEANAKTQALRDQLLQGQVDAQNNQKQINTNKAIIAAINNNPDPDALYKNFSIDEINNALGPALNTPWLSHYATQEGRDQFKSGYIDIAQGMPNPANNNTFNGPLLTQGVTKAFKPQIDMQAAGKGNDVTGGEIDSIYPAKSDPGKFYMGMKVYHADGTYDVGVPWTVNGTSDPNDTAKPFDFNQVMDTLQRHALLVHHLDLQNAKLGDQTTQNRLDAQSQNQDLMEQIYQYNRANLNATPEERTSAISRSALLSGRGTSESIALGKTFGASAREHALDDAAKANRLVSNNFSTYYDNPDAMATDARMIQSYNPSLANALVKGSQIADPQQRKAYLDGLQYNAESYAGKAALGKTNIMEVPDKAGGTQVFTQKGTDAAAGKEPTAWEEMGQSVQSKITPLLAGEHVKDIDKELYLLSKKDQGQQALEDAMQDPNMKAVVDKSPQLQQMLGSEDTREKQQYRETLYAERAQYDAIVKGQQQPKTVGATPQPTGRVKLQSNGDPSQVKYASPQQR